MKIRDHRELLVYQKAFAAALRVFDVSESFPKKEMFSLTDQARRSSRSVRANLAEAWRKRRYEAAFITKLNDAETEAAETQVLKHRSGLSSPFAIAISKPDWAKPCIKSTMKLFASSSV